MPVPVNFASRCFGHLPAGGKAGGPPWSVGAGREECRRGTRLESAPVRVPPPEGVVES